MNASIRPSFGLHRHQGKVHFERRKHVVFLEQSRLLSTVFLLLGVRAYAAGVQTQNNSSDGNVRSTLPVQRSIFGTGCAKRATTVEWRGLNDLRFDRCVKQLG
jgi:hypothetical protein